MVQRRAVVSRLTQVAVPAALGVLLIVEVTVGSEFRGHPPGPAVVTGLGMIVALCWRRSSPLASAAVVSAFFVAYPFVEREPAESLVHAVALLVSAYSVGVQCLLRPALLGAAVVTVAGLLRSWQMGMYDVGSVAVNALWALVAWGIGRAMHGRDRRMTMAQQALSETERLRALDEREAVSAERSRIARELHDVVAHAVTVIVVQARGARRAIESDVGEVRRSLDAIEEMGRDAIDELRRMLALLGDPDDQEVRSGPAELRALVARVDQAGLPVTLTISGEPGHRATSVDVSAYRVVQEALTNALRHGGGPATVAVVYGEDCIDVHVDSDLGVQTFTGSGRGLAGLRERVRLTGGSLEVGPTDNGRYRVHAELPLESPA